MNETSDDRLELAVLGCVNKRVDTAAHHQHDDGEVVERARDFDGVANVVDDRVQHVHGETRHEPTAHHQ